MYAFVNLLNSNKTVQTNLQNVTMMSLWPIFSLSLFGPISGASFINSCDSDGVTETKHFAILNILYTYFVGMKEKNMQSENKKDNRR